MSDAGGRPAPALVGPGRPARPGSGRAGEAGGRGVGLWPSAFGGFTLVELLVTTSLMALVAGATVAALAGGIRVWERSVEFGTHQQSVLVAFTQVEHDLRNVRRFTLVPFEGVYDRVSLASVDRPREPNALPELGRLGYYVNEREHLLCRSFVPYPLVRHLRVTDRCQPVLEGVAQIRLSYFGTDEDSKTTGWSEHWRSPTTPPIAVKIELSLQEGPKRVSTHAAVIYVADPEPPEPHDANHQ